MLGDEGLKQIGRLIRSIVRDSDVAARYGGDEFALLPNTDKQGALILADRIRSLISEFDHDVLSEENVTVSAGVSTYRGGTSHIFDQLAHWANRAMLEAKDKGKKQVVFYDVT